MYFHAGQWLAYHISKIADVDELPPTAYKGVDFGAMADFGLYRTGPAALLRLAASRDMR